MGLSRRSLLGHLGFATVLAGAGVVSSSRWNPTRTSTKAKALVAGSLLALANEVPGASIEAHGSVAVRRLVLDGMREPDAIALADPRLFEGIISETTIFATNALVLAYNPNSPHSDELDAGWQTALEADGISIGRTDPKKDPLGYRTVMALRLASRFFDVNAQALLSNARIFRETDILNTLAAGQIDAAFAYRNMAIQRDLPYVELPDKIDFSNPQFRKTYRSVSFDLHGKTVQGAPIRYAATAFTETGQPWVGRLVTATELLRDFGFVVPRGYPMSTNVQS